MTYVLKPATWNFDYWEPDAKSMAVIEDITHPVDTGLLDANGVRIFRVPDKHPVGFCR